MAAQAYDDLQRNYTPAMRNTTASAPGATAATTGDLAPGMSQKACDLSLCRASDWDWVPFGDDKNFEASIDVTCPFSGYRKSLLSCVFRKAGRLFSLPQ